MLRVSQVCVLDNVLSWCYFGTSPLSSTLDEEPPLTYEQASWTTFGCQSYEATWSWRVPTILQAGYPLVQLCFLYWVPESPRWLISKDRSAEALKIIAKYHAAGDTQSPLVLREMSEIVETIKMEQQAKATKWSTLVATSGNRKRLFIVVCLGAFAQWNGIGVVSYYLTLVLDTVGVTDPFDQTLINGLLQVCAYYNPIVNGRADLVTDLQFRCSVFCRLHGGPPGTKDALQLEWDWDACVLHYLDRMFGCEQYDRINCCRHRCHYLPLHLLLPL